MELDKTRIAIRQRSMLDIVDLSIIVIRKYWLPLAIWSAPGVAIMMLINTIVLFPLTKYESIAVYSYQFDSLIGFRIRYICYLVALTSIQSALAFIGTTFFLGQAVFIERPSWKEFRLAISEMGRAIVWVIGIVRLGLLAWLFRLFLPETMQFEAFIELFYFGFVAMGIVTVVRMARPFALEILLLERSKLYVKKSERDTTLSFARRSKYLHGSYASDVLGRWLTVTMVSGLLVAALTLGELSVSGMFFGSWTWDWWVDMIALPINLWIASFWACVIRFLSYLDTRIRAEGWELMLRLRAESRRIEGDAK